MAGNAAPSEFDDEYENVPVDETDSPYVGIPKSYIGPLAKEEFQQLPPRGTRGKRYGELRAAAPVQERSRFRGFLPGSTDPYQRYTKRDALAIAGWDQRQVLGFQRAMMELGSPFGFGPRTKFVPGLADGPTIEGWKRLLSHANRRGLNWQEALSEIGTAQAELGTAGGGAGRQPFTAPPFQPEAEANLRAAIETAQQESEGRVNPAFVQRALTQYRTLERERHERVTAAQRAEYEGAPAAPEVPQLPAPELFGAERARAERPVETGAYDVVKQFQALLRILGVDSR